jgi:hypothetical protein
LDNKENSVILINLIFIQGGCGLYDPCEKDPTDVSDILKNQQREELTSSAQVDLNLSNRKKFETRLIYSFFFICVKMALRLLAFKQIHKILGMECLPSNNSNSNNLGQMRGARKRQYPSTGNDSQSKLKLFSFF